MTTSTKNDHSKPDFMPMLTGMQSVIDYGAAKYGAGNWMASIGTDKHDEFQSRLLAAAIRHIVATDEMYTDDESHLMHIDHALTCLFMARTYQLASLDQMIKDFNNPFLEDSTMGKMATKKAVKKTAVKKVAKKKVAKKAAK